MKKKKHRLKALLGGFAAGFVNGMLGAGGGMLAVPALKGCGLDRKESHANSVAVIMPLSLFSAILYLSAGNVAFTDALPYLPSGLAGAAAGAALLSKVPDKWLRRLFSLFMIWAGVRLMLK